MTARIADGVNDAWKVLDPPTLMRAWANIKNVMPPPSALDTLTA